MHVCLWYQQYHIGLVCTVGEGAPPRTSPSALSVVSVRVYYVGGLVPPDTT